jgi:threonine-phosphate decarboxylase
MKDTKDLYKHGGNIYEIKRRYHKDVIDFSANINPLGIPLQIKKLLRQETSGLSHYPDPESHNLRSAVARYWNVSEENVLAGNGSTELIYLILNAFQPPVLTLPAPSFSEYERAARILKKKVRFIPLSADKDFSLNTRQIKDCGMLFLCNPNNPTGNLVVENCADIENIPAKRIVIDEAFLDFVQDEKERTFIPEAVRSKRIIVLRTMTKLFALPGVRVGYVIAHKDIIRILKRYQIPWSVNVLAQRAAEYALSEDAFMQRSKQLIEKERFFLYEALSRIKGFKPYPSVANFILVKIEDRHITSMRLKEKLIKKGILIRDCANFRGLNERFVRAAVRTHKENRRLIRALEECV